MKNKRLFALFLLAIPLAIFSWGGETPQGDGFPCGAIPNTFPSVPNPCNVRANSCAPIDPPPTPWNFLCCRDEGSTGCLTVYWRHQCCYKGNGKYEWGYAYMSELIVAGSACMPGGCV